MFFLVGLFYLLIRWFFFCKKIKIFGNSKNHMYMCNSRTGDFINLFYQIVAKGALIAAFEKVDIRLHTSVGRLRMLQSIPKVIGLALVSPIRIIFLAFHSADIYFYQFWFLEFLFILPQLPAWSGKFKFNFAEFIMQRSFLDFILFLFGDQPAAGFNRQRFNLPFKS